MRVGEGSNCVGLYPYELINRHPTSVHLDGRLLPDERDETFVHPRLSEVRLASTLR